MDDGPLARHPAVPGAYPHANPIENLWAVLARRLYAKGLQYDDLGDLKDAPQMAWDDISLA